MSKKATLLKLTGLSPDQIADVLVENPRAYMAVKGAVAEKHLELQFESLRSKGLISFFRRGHGDFEKDFYVQISKAGPEIKVECKNVQVASIASADTKANYLRFLARTHRIELSAGAVGKMSSAELTAAIKKLSQEFRESGIPRYEFSAGVMKAGSTLAHGAAPYLAQFKKAPISIDFQRTRNSRDLKDGSNQKSQRFYEFKEVDVVAACLFSRTMKWEFVFAASRDLDCHPQFRSRINCKMVLNPSVWHGDFFDAAHRVRR